MNNVCDRGVFVKAGYQDGDIIRFIAAVNRTIPHRLIISDDLHLSRRSKAIAPRGKPRELR